MASKREEENVKAGTPPENIRFSDISPAMEFACWVVVCLAPFLRWVNGAAVTSDQFFIQLTLFSGALVGAVVLRVVHLVRERS